ncbi:AAA family ATPase [bacterium]|nr:AAA family ATPase [bacterium]
MAYRIAVSGKGGVGKTTVAALAIRFLTEHVGKSVLAVDADPNATLGLTLGIDVETTVADIREETLEKKDAIPAGMSKDRFVEYRIAQCIGEHEGFDLLTMGRPEGPGCYCFVNSLLRRYLERAAEDYAYVVVDNEAGMEHLSRRTDSTVDLLLIVTEPTVVGIETARRVAVMGDELPVAVRRTVVLLNRTSPLGLIPEVRERIEKAHLHIVGEIPLNDGILASSMSGTPLLQLPDDNTFYATVRHILAQELNLPAAAS